MVVMCLQFPACCNDGADCLPTTEANRGLPTFLGATRRRAAIILKTHLMEMLGHPSWGWGVSLIALTIAIHATAVVMMAFVGVRIRARLEARSHDLWKLIAVLIWMIAVIGPIG
jgi:hypothetical protein